MINNYYIIEQKLQNRQNILNKYNEIYRILILYDKYYSIFLKLKKQNYYN